MLLSTLPDLPGRTYDVKGIVFSRIWITGSALTAENLIRKHNQSLEITFNVLVEQAFSMGADAIVDIKITDLGGTGVVTGTAVKLT